MGMGMVKWGASNLAGYTKTPQDFDAPLTSRVPAVWNLNGLSILHCSKKLGIHARGHI